MTTGCSQNVLTLLHSLRFLLILIRLERCIWVCECVSHAFHMYVFALSCKSLWIKASAKKLLQLYECIWKFHMWTWMRFIYINKSISHMWMWVFSSMNVCADFTCEWVSHVCVRTVWIISLTDPHTKDCSRFRRSPTCLHNLCWAADVLERMSAVCTEQLPPSSPPLPAVVGNTCPSPQVPALSLFSSAGRHKRQTQTC